MLTLVNGPDLYTWLSVPAAGPRTRALPSHAANSVGTTMTASVESHDEEDAAALLVASAT